MVLTSIENGEEIDVQLTRVFRINIEDHVVISNPDVKIELKSNLGNEISLSLW